MELSPQLCPNLQESFDQAEHKDELRQEVQPYFGKLEQGESFACPESMPDSGEQVAGLIFYQTMEEETQMEKTTGDVAGATGHPGNPLKTAPVCLSEQVEEITERQMDHEPFMDVSVQNLDAKGTVMELESIYSGYTQTPSPAASAPTPPITSLSDEGAAKTDEGVSAEDPAGRDACESVGEDGTLLPGIIKCRSRTLSHDRDGKEDDLRPNETGMSPVSANSSHPNVFLPPGSGCGSATRELQLPVKTEETEGEPAEDAYPDGSAVKEGGFLSAVKTEGGVAKDEQSDYPIKPETLDSKPELLGMSVKPEGLDGSKPDVYSAFSDGARLKAEMKPEGLEFATYPDSSGEKCSAKAEPLESTLAELKGKAKQELLEADSTVLTPKLEQSDGPVDTAAGLVVKGEVKKPCTPGSNNNINSNNNKVLRLSECVLCVQAALCAFKWQQGL